MNIVICDDDLTDRKVLMDLLIIYEQKNNQSFRFIEFESGVTLCEAHSVLQDCQLIFLDINMTEIDGLQAARKLKEFYPGIPIVLVTAYMNYALDGYKVKASRFLLKEELDQTINECMDSLLKEIRQYDETMEFSFVEGKIMLRIDDIIYIETARHKNLFYTKRQVYSIYKKLDEIEAILGGMHFVRTHQSFLVNMRYIEKISSYVLTLTNGKELSVPKSRYPDVKRRYTLFKGDE